MAGVTKNNSTQASSDKAKPTSLTERGLSGVTAAESSPLDNWLREPPSITDKIAFHLPGRATLPSRATTAGLGNLDNTNSPNWARMMPEQPWNMGSLSINLKY